MVDDGSGPSYSHFFEELKQYPECEVLGYEVNQGKGYALKYGMRHVQAAYPDTPGVVTADSDGQHTAPDCIKIAEAMIAQPNKLVLGSRDFSLGFIPPKSRFGNRMTSFSLNPVWQLAAGYTDWAAASAVNHAPDCRDPRLPV